MRGNFDKAGKSLEVDFSKGIDISIPLDFNGDQPNTYGVKKATSAPFKDDQFIGDTREGGPCNFETYSITTHCNGTHTECIGHITNERISILNSLNEELIPATLISITPKNIQESYIPKLCADDLLISKEDLESHLSNVNPSFLQAVIIRTLPNSISKIKRNYMKEEPSFFSIDAMKYIVDLGVNHLLVDIPSVDRLLDDGYLSAHNIFWETKGKKFNQYAKYKTITEMIFVDDDIKDGSYLLNLQIPPFVSGASPSSPIIYNIYGL